MKQKIEVYETLEIAKKEFGENYGAYVFKLTRDQVESLLNGKGNRSRGCPDQF